MDSVIHIQVCDVSSAPGEETVTEGSFCPTFTPVNTPVISTVHQSGDKDCQLLSVPKVLQNRNIAFIEGIFRLVGIENSLENPILCLSLRVRCLEWSAAPSVRLFTERWLNYELQDTQMSPDTRGSWSRDTSDCDHCDMEI